MRNLCFFVRNTGERNALVSVGRRYEGIAWKASDSNDPVCSFYESDLSGYQSDLLFLFLIIFDFLLFKVIPAVCVDRNN